MALIVKPNTFTANTTIVASEHNANFDTVYSLVNGNIDNANIKDNAAIADSKLAQIVTASKIAGSALNNAWPIGSVFIAVVDTNPETLLGFGTWSAFAAGKMLVGLNASDADFDTVEETGGAKTANLAHTHSVTPNTGTAEAGGGQPVAYQGAVTSGSSGSATQSIMNPYIVVYMWKRVS